MSLSIQLKPLIAAPALVREPTPDKHWVVPDFLERGDRLIITGNEGDGKSTWIRQLAIQLACGVQPFTLEPIEPCRVVLMDLENPREHIKDMLADQCHRAGVDVPDNLMIGNWPSGLNLTSSDYEAALQEALKGSRPDVIVGGPLYKMTEMSLADENISRSITAVLDRLRENLSCCLILEAHQVNESTGYDSNQKQFVRNRPMRPFGSSIWRRWPEFGLCLFYDGTLHHWRGDRKERKWPIKLQRDGDTWLWQPDNERCPVCNGARPFEKEVYCSTRCRETAKKRRQRERKTEEIGDWKLAI